MTAPLELTKNALRRHFALEVLDRTLDTFVTYHDLDRPTLYRFSNRHIRCLLLNLRLNLKRLCVTHRQFTQPSGD